VDIPTLRGETPDQDDPLWKYFNFARIETNGFVKRKITIKSTAVVKPRVNANPRTLPTDTMYKTTDEITETRSATITVLRARCQPVSKLPAKVSRHASHHGYVRSRR